MKTIIYRSAFFTILLLLSAAISAQAAQEKVQSFHLGFLYPNGVDVIGYSVEEKMSRHTYRFYTFGIPSFAAIGLSYYDSFEGDGWCATVGVGIGSIMYSSLAYQWRVNNQDYVKLGAGFTTGVAYTGGYPALSYEHRFYD